jgi:hypothetical protein
MRLFSALNSAAALGLGVQRRAQRQGIGAAARLSRGRRGAAREFRLERRRLAVEPGEAIGLGGIAADEALGSGAERRVSLIMRSSEAPMSETIVLCRPSSARISALAPNPAARSMSCAAPLAIPLTPTPT